MSNSKSRRARDPSSLSNSPHLTHARTHSSATSNHRSALQKPPVVSAPSPQPSSGMTAVSRYNQNLKVLRRNDPSIVSIIDQFSHVCLYHHNGAKWEKKGYEGSMFLFERNAYPPYGLYILNRMGMDDYVLYIYPEDDIEARGEYLMYRCYPDFTAKRLAMARPTYSFPSKETDSVHTLSSSISATPALSPQQQSITSPNDFADARGREPSSTDIVTNWKLLLADSKEKGLPVTFGFWMFVTDVRESMQDVMIRLSSYIRDMVPYPEQYRYGPDRPPPPPNSHPAQKPITDERTEQTPPNVTAGMSEIDKLFAKLTPSGASSGATLSNSTTPAPSGAAKLTLNDLFASASIPPTPSATSVNNFNDNVDTRDPSRPSSFLDHSSSSVPQSTSGLALLSSIFASATPVDNVTSQSSNATHTNGKSTAHIPNTVANYGTHDSSASPFPAPPSAPPSTRLSFADAQMTLNTDSDGYNGQQNSQAYEIHSPKPTSSTLPQILTQDVISSLLGIPSQSSSRASSSSSWHSQSQPLRYEGDVESGDENDSPYITDSYRRHGAVNGAVDGSSSLSSTSVLGDVTPRPPLRGFSGDATPTEVATPPSHTLSPHPTFSAPATSSRSDAPSLLASTSSSSTVTVTHAPNDSYHSQSRPSSRAVQGTNATSAASPALSHTSQTRSTGSRTNTPLNAQSNGRLLVPFHQDTPLWPYPRAPLDDRDGTGDESDVVELDFADTSALSDMAAFDRRVQENEKKGSKRTQKKSRKERERENEKERAEIEKSWDAPEPAIPASALPVPTTDASEHHDNGAAAPQDKGKKPTTHDPVGPLNQGTARESILATLPGRSQPSYSPNISRNDFVRELLTTIHTDKSFVDSLWTGYCRRLQAEG